MAFPQSECVASVQAAVRLPDRSRPADTPRNHQYWMAQAIALARAMQGRVWPNPAVGCVIVRDGEIVGRGQTQFGGRPHAERVALDDAGVQANGAVLYVTLEPCSHWGKTPPCADAIIAAGIICVHAALQDPDPRVNGGGFRRLLEAGVKVQVGLAADEARKIMAGFFHRVATGQPLLTIGARPEPPIAIPDGFDALLHSIDGRPWLTTRKKAGGAMTVALGQTSGAQALLGELGSQGLTSIYLPSDDQLVESVRARLGGTR